MKNTKFKRYTRLYEGGDAYLPASGLTLRGDGELIGPAITRFAFYESLLQMEPAEAALKIRQYQACKRSKKTPHVSGTPATPALSSGQSESGPCQSILDFLKFEANTSHIWPWAIPAEQINFPELCDIVLRALPFDPAEGYDTEALYHCLDDALGVNPLLESEGQKE